MKTPTLLRVTPLLLCGAALLSACADRLPSDAGLAAPGALRRTLTPTTPFASIEPGGTHTCALTSGGQAYCWGRNNGGQIGNFTFTNQTTPQAVQQSGGLTFTAVTAGGDHSCAITSGGQAYCWGYNGDSRLGDTTVTPRDTPVAVIQGAIAFTSISAGKAHTCGLNSSGQAYCWGDNTYGQIGDNTTADALTPVAVQHPAGVTFTQIVAADRHTCALTSGGQAYCWGYGGDGAIGNNSSIGPRVPTAAQQPVGVTFTQIGAEGLHTCAVTSGGQAYCWGRNDFGQVGDGTTTQRNVPTAVSQPGGVGFVSVYTNGTFTCAVTSGGQGYCWGSNNRGQLGIGSTAASSTPAAVSQPAGVSFATVRPGGAFACGLDTGGQTYCWGHNAYGQVGDGTTTQRTTPVAVSH